MNKKLVVIPIVASIALVLTVFSTMSFPEDKSESTELYHNTFLYSDTEKLKRFLSTLDVFMSEPVEIFDDTVNHYCTYVDLEGNEKISNYCVTSALTDSNHKPFGNLNMGGDDSAVPQMVLSIVDSSPFIDSKKNEVRQVFTTMIETLVCDCWEEQQPGGFESISDWLDTAEDRYVESGKTTLSSKISGLDQKQLILEITLKDSDYLWTLIILNS